MAKRRRKQHHEEHVDESWLIPYADILTLLLALFIVLFASSTVDAQKLEKISRTFGEIFDSGEGIMDYNAAVEIPSDTLTPGNNEYAKDQEALADVQEAVEEYIRTEQLGEQLDAKLTPDGLLITIRDSVLFEPGKAEVKGEYKSLIADISKLLAFDPPRAVMVTGHTDNVPMNTPEFSSNWDLSVMRAVNFLKLIIANEELDPRWFSAKGEGEFNPIADNETSEGRAQNRRVEILVQPRIEEDGTLTKQP